MSDVLGTLRPPPGSRTARKRVGRGRGSGLGKTCGRGQKGQGARGQGPRTGFEGGQIPLQRRLPKRGFTPPRHVRWQIVNLRDLGRFQAGALIDPDVLRAARLVRRSGPVKILGHGVLDRALTVKAHGFSAAAMERIIAAGGTIERIGGKLDTPVGGGEGAAG